MVAGFTGLVLLALGLPRLVGDVLFTPASPVFQSVISQRAPLSLEGPNGPIENASLEVLLTKLDRHEEALTFSETAAARLALARLYFDAARQAETMGEVDLALRFYRHSIENYRRGLIEDPGRPYAWTRLAVALSQAPLEDLPLNEVLARAIDAAPYAKDLMVPRIHVGFSNWDALDSVTQKQVARQVKIAAFLFPRDLAWGMRNGRDRFLTRYILLGTPPLSDRFEAALRGEDPGPPGP